ncbi:MAG TPA: hypothetical protein VK395_01630 [Gemmataceae bacterium]|nr:hypothetical protein [Gemmataceae bacterium]
MPNTRALPVEVHVIDPAGVYFPDTAGPILSLKKTSLAREIREGRLRCARRCGRRIILGQHLLEWLGAGVGRTKSVLKPFLGHANLDIDSGMANVPEKPDALTTLRQLTLTEIEQRLADIDAERAALSLLRRSLAARERVRRRSEQRSVAAEGPHDV